MVMMRFGKNDRCQNDAYTYEFPLAALAADPLVFLIIAAGANEEEKS